MLTNRSIFIFLSALLIVTFAPIPSTAKHDNRSIQTRRILKSASELDYPPFCIVRDDGTADGFSVDLLKAVCQAVGFDINFTVSPWHEIKHKLRQGYFDVLPLVSYSSERERVFDFTAPYLRMHGTIFVRKGEKSIRTEADLEDKEVLVMRDDTAHEYAVKKNLSNKLILTDNFEEAMRLLSNGKHDAVVIQQLVGLQLIKKLKISNVVSVNSFRESNLKTTARPLSGFEQKFCFAVREGDKELLALLNEGLAIVIGEGVYDKIYEKWFGPILPQPLISFAMLTKRLFIILVPILCVIGIIGIWYLKSEVARKTKYLKAEIKEREQVEETLRESEEKIKKSLKEKEILLRELYHRTKNNMQVIGGLLTLQSSYTDDEMIIEVFRETENRIMSMALVHQKLYQSRDLSEIDLKNYIEDLTHALLKSYQVNREKISLSFEMECIPISVDMAMSCGLIVNEILSNVLKHAFPAYRSGEIKITLHSANRDRIELRIKDNGVGISQNIDLNNPATLGLQLIDDLVTRQLRGKLILNRGDGTEFIISFKEISPDPRV